MEPSEYQPFSPEVHAFVDGRMDADAERDFERRMQRSPELKRQVLGLQQAIQMLHDLPVHEPPEDFDGNVIGRIREEELADRARKRIAAAPAPIWQNVVQVGIGAVAASLILAIIGVPGLFGPDDNSLETDSSVSPLAQVEPTEDDLLPALADHATRFESLRRSLEHTSVEDPRAQRRLIALELEHSDLVRRNRWLAGEVMSLPAEQRLEYMNFIQSLDDALATIQTEINESRTEQRDVNMKAVNLSLNGVNLPDGRVQNFRFSMQNGANFGGGAAEIAVDEADEFAVYALVRQADYCHDHEAVLDAAEIYLRLFGRGHFKDNVNAAAVVADLRLGRETEAAERFINKFGEYDEDLTPSQQKLVKGLMTESEYKQLVKARDVVRDGK